MRETSTDEVVNDETEEGDDEEAGPLLAYEKAVESWGVDPRSRSGVALKGLLKSADQSTPMMMVSYKKRWGMRLALLIMVAMVISFATAFVWIAREAFARGKFCTKGNGCKTCTLMPADESQKRNSWKDEAKTECDQLARTTLEINAGCLSASIPNSRGFIAAGARGGGCTRRG